MIVMINAMEEFLPFLVRKSKIVCAEVCYSPLLPPQQPDIYDEDENSSATTSPSNDFNLPVGYTEEELDKFIRSLNFNYNNGFGLQCLYGTVWFDDGSWGTRGEYDGSEWWEIHSIPEIPEHLKKSL
jgi:hypothetical protein